MDWAQTTRQGLARRAKWAITRTCEAQKRSLAKVRASPREKPPELPGAERRMTPDKPITRAIQTKREGTWPRTKPKRGTMLTYRAVMKPDLEAVVVRRPKYWSPVPAQRRHPARKPPHSQVQGEYLAK
jgi:hypothetical protein